jgi:hypothetical protein
MLSELQKHLQEELEINNKKRKTIEKKLEKLLPTLQSDTQI